MPWPCTSCFGADVCPVGEFSQPQGVGLAEGGSSQEEEVVAFASTLRAVSRPTGPTKTTEGQVSAIRRQQRSQGKLRLLPELHEEPTQDTEAESKVDTIIRQQRERESRAKLRLLKFLERNDFKHAAVNCRRVRFFGLSFTYPLHEAAKKNDQYIVRLLLRFGANVRNKAGVGIVEAVLKSI